MIISEKKRSLIHKCIPTLIIFLVLACLVAASQVTGSSARLYTAGVLVGFAVLSWTFGLLVEPLTTLIFFLLVILFAVAPPATVFSGFASGAWWLLLGGSIIAAAVGLTGLGKRLANALFARWQLSYRKAVAVVAFGAVGLSFLMPSTMARTLLLIPIVSAFAENLGLTRDRPGYIGLILTAAAATYMPSTAILPANIPNTILLGAADTLYGVKLTYGPYFLLHFPVLGILKTLALIGVVCWLFPDSQPLRRVSDDETPVSAPEKRLAVLLFLALLLYATDSIHSISPAWVTLGIGILCLLPPYGVITPKMASEKTSMITLIYIAGILGLGAVVAETGLGVSISHHILDFVHLTPGHTAFNTAMLTVIGIVLTMVTTATGVPAVLTPLAKSFSTATGLPILTVLMLQVVSFSTVLLPYVSPPMMVWLEMCGVSIRLASKLCLVLGAVTILVLFPIDYAWWWLLGYLP